MKVFAGETGIVKVLANGIVSQAPVRHSPTIIKQTVILCYEFSDQVFQSGVSLEQLLSACHCKSHDTFENCSQSEPLGARIREI